MGQVIALNVDTISSFCLTHLVEVSAFKMFSVCFALVMMALEDESFRCSNYKDSKLFSKFCTNNFWRNDQLRHGTYVI